MVVHYYCHADSQQKGFMVDSQQEGSLPWCCWRFPPIVLLKVPSHCVVERIPHMAWLKGSLPWCCWKDHSHGVVEKIASMVLLKGFLPWCCWKDRSHGVVEGVVSMVLCLTYRERGHVVGLLGLDAILRKGLCVAFSRLPPAYSNDAIESMNMIITRALSRNVHVGARNVKS